jgi:hypothetical protein
MNTRIAMLAIGAAFILAIAGCARKAPPITDDANALAVEGDGLVSMRVEMADGEVVVVPLAPDAPGGALPTEGYQLDPQRHKRLNVAWKYRDRYPMPIIDPPGSYPMLVVRPDPSTAYTMRIVEEVPEPLPMASPSRTQR